MPVANTSPVHLTTPQPFGQTNGTLNANRDGSGSIVSLVTAVTTANGGQGGAILGLRANHCGAIGTTPTTMAIRLWLTKAGGSPRFWRELILTTTGVLAVGAAGPTVALAAADYPELAAGDSLGFTQSVSEVIHITGLYREY